MTLLNLLALQWVAAPNALSVRISSGCLRRLLVLSPFLQIHSNKTFFLVSTDAHCTAASLPQTNRCVNDADDKRTVPCSKKHDCRLNFHVVKETRPHVLGVRLEVFERSSKLVFVIFFARLSSLYFLLQVLHCLFSSCPCSTMTNGEVSLCLSLGNVLFATSNLTCCAPLHLYSVLVRWLAGVRSALRLHMRLHERSATSEAASAFREKRFLWNILQRYAW